MSCWFRNSNYNSLKIYVMSNKQLGLMALVDAPWLLIGTLAELRQPEWAETWFTGFWGLLYMTGWTCSAIVLNRLNATGTSLWGRTVIRVDWHLGPCQRFERVANFCAAKQARFLLVLRLVLAGKQRGYARSWGIGSRNKNLERLAPVCAAHDGALAAALHVPENTCGTLALYFTLRRLFSNCLGIACFSRYACRPCIIGCPF